MRDWPVFPVMPSIASGGGHPESALFAACFGSFDASVRPGVSGRVSLGGPVFTASPPHAATRQATGSPSAAVAIHASRKGDHRPQHRERPPHPLLDRHGMQARTMGCDVKRYGVMRANCEEIAPQTKRLLNTTACHSGSATLASGAEML